MEDVYNVDVSQLKQEIIKLNKRIAELEKENEESTSIIVQNNLAVARKDHKDRLFRFIFGDRGNKSWTLSLYNALNQTAYTDPEAIQFNTIGDVIYLRMKNDISFIVATEMNIWEHQSTYNPNMPLRFLLYGGRLYDKYAKQVKLDKFSSTLQKIPRPKCICFYNGLAEEPEKKELLLSDAYDGNGDIEVKVTMLNVNYGKNQALMNSCAPLREYAWLVNRVRTLLNEGIDRDRAFDIALSEMLDDYEIKSFLIEHKAEVKDMFLTEYDEDEDRNNLLKEGVAKGVAIGEARGVAKGVAIGEARGVAKGVAIGEARGKKLARAVDRKRDKARSALRMIREAKLSAMHIGLGSGYKEETIDRMASMMGKTLPLSP